MADGTVKIDVILSDGKVGKGIAKVDKSLGGLNGAAKKVSVSIGSIVKSLGLVALASKGIDMVTQSLSGAIDRYDTLNNFPRVMQQMGFDASESEGAINKLSDGIQGLPTTLDSVASTAQNIAIMTGDLDGATDTTLALNDAFLASGASSADAERGLEQYVQMLSKGEVDLQSWRTLQETMGVALNDVAKAFGFTGKAAQNDLYDALKSGEITFDEFNGKLIELDTAQGGFAERAKTASGGIKTAYTNMKTAVVRGLESIIESIDSVLSQIPLKSIENVLEQIGNAFNDVLTLIAEGIPKAVEKIKEIYNTLEPWLPLIKSIAGSVGIMITAFSAMNTAKKIIDGVKLAVMGMNKAILLNPWTWVVGIAIAAVLLIIQYWEPIKAFFLELWEYIKEIFMSVWEPIVEAWNIAIEWLKETWNSITTFFAELWEGIKEIFINVWDALVELWQQKVERFKEIFSPIVDFFSETWQTVSEVFSDVWETITEMLSTIWENVKTIASMLWEGIKLAILGPILLLIRLVTGDMETLKSNLLDIWTRIKEIASTLWESLKNIVSTLMSNLGNILKSIWSGIKSVASSFWETIKSIASNIWEGIKSKISSLMETLASLLSTIWEGIKTVASNVWNGIKNTASTIWNNIETTVSNLASKAKDGAIKAWNTLKRKTSEAFDKVVDFIKDPLENIDLFEIGKNIIQGLINGIGSMATAVWDKAKDIAGGIGTAIEKKLGIHSPSRVTMELGRYTGEGFRIGIDDEAKQAFKSSKNLAKGVSDSFDSDVNSGFKNRLRGLKASMNIVTSNYVPIAAGQVQSDSRLNDELVNVLADQNKLLEEIRDKDQDLYIDSDKVTDVVNSNNAIIATLNKF